MRPAFHPFLVNDSFGDPALVIDFLFESRALMVDLGDIHALSPRYLLRVSDIFISHCHMDHFMGFDWLVRIRLGREGGLRLYGPPGFLHQVESKLAGYTWNLVHNYENDFVITATEVHEDGAAWRADFPMRRAFRRENETSFCTEDLVLLDEPGFRVRCTFLDHRTPCLAFALEEGRHVNVWKNCLEEKGLPVGPWLKQLKQAVLEGRPSDTPVIGPDGRPRPLAVLLDCVRLTPGMKIVYVTDAAFSPGNAERIQALAMGADKLFIEAVFAHEMAARAREKHHLTAAQAGWLAHRAGAKSVVPFHHSPVYHDREALLRQELEDHFRRGAMPESPG